MTPQEGKDLLLRVVTKLASKQLAEGGFIPFGATLGSNHDVQLLMPKSMKKDVTQRELDAYWARELSKAVATGNCKIVCHCADVMATAENGSLVPLMLVHIEHPASYSEDILYPYQKEGTQVLFLVNL